jgi:hypothetical protein
MTLAAFGSGTQTATIGTEHFVASVNEVGVYTFHVDLVNMVAGDYLELRVYQMVLTGGTQRVVHVETFQDAQPTDGLIAISVPISNELTDTNALRFSLKQTIPTGGGRNFPWKVLKHS